MALFVRYQPISLGGGGGGGVTTVGTIDSQTPSLNGGTVIGSTLYFQSASTSDPGLVNLVAQSFLGQKTFTTGLTGTLTGSASLNVLTSAVGQPNGVASLDSAGHVPLTQLPPTLVEYLGTWNASTNTPTLANGTGISGQFYIVAVAGTTDFGAGPIAFNSGDWVLYNGTIWERAVQSNIVQSVNGQTGIVTINAINQLTGDGTAGPASGSASAALTLATVNSNVGSFTNASVTVNSKGLVTAASSGTPVVPGGTSGQVQYNNAGAFGGFGSWNGTTLAITGAISSTTTLSVGTNLHVFGTSIMAGDMVVQGGANFSGNLGFYGSSEIAQPTGNVLTALSNLGLVSSPTLSLSNLPTQANNTILGNNSGITASPSALTVAQVNAILPVFTATLNGLAPLSGGGTTNFLRADGTWAVAGTGSVSSFSFTNQDNVTGTVTNSTTTPTLALAPTSPTPAATSFASWDANKNLSANNHVEGYTTTATAAGTTVLTVSSTYQQFFTGTTTQTVALPVVTGLVLGFSFVVTNNSTGIVTVQSSGANTVLAQAANTTAVYTCILVTGTTAASWNASVIGAGGAVTPTVSKALSSGTTTGTGGFVSGTYTAPTNVSYIIVEAVGPGGGGGANGTTGTQGANGSGSTTFGSSLLTAGAGSGGGTAGGNGGAGGTATITTSSTVLQVLALSGGSGQGSANTSATVFGGSGGNNPFAGAGSGSGGGAVGFAGVANTGGGGGGAGYGGGASSAGSGGGAGGYVKAIIIPTANQTFSYSVGSGGAGGTGSGSSGGAGALGAIIVTEYYNNGAVGTATTITGTIGSANVTTATFLPPTQQVFTSSTTYTIPTSPRKPLYVKVTVTGGGGGGGGGANVTGGGGGGGGGGAGTSIAWVAGTSITSSQTVTIGAGGTNGAASSGGSNGGTSSFGSFASATGGFGGAGGTAANAPGLAGQGGAGSLGTSNFSGNSGQSGTLGVASVASSTGGTGGGSFFGGSGAGGVVSGAGQGASEYGGGGGGGATSAAGGLGFHGYILVEEYYQ